MVPVAATLLTRPPIHVISLKPPTTRACHQFQPVAAEATPKLLHAEFVSSSNFAPSTSSSTAASLQ